MRILGIIAALAASSLGAATASADEASVKAALGKRPTSTLVGISSYYGPGFHGRRTADGEIFDMHGLSAAHKTLPIPCYARVTNLRNGHSVVLRINDRGPYIAGRMLDVSMRAARLLGFGGGLARVKLDYLGPAGPAGAGEERALLASLNTGETSGETVATRATPPALAYSQPPKRAPAEAALEAAVRPTLLSLAAKLDTSELRLTPASEPTRAAAANNPFGALVTAPFKPLVEALR